MTEQSRHRYVIQLTTIATDLEAAKQSARSIARSLAIVGSIEIGATTIAEEGCRDVPHQVFCDRQLDRGRRCGLRADHGGRCHPDPLR